MKLNVYCLRSKVLEENLRFPYYEGADTYQHISNLVTESFPSTWVMLEYEMGIAYNDGSWDSTYSLCKNNWNNMCKTVSKERAAVASVCPSDS